MLRFLSQVKVCVVDSGYAPHVDLPTPTGIAYLGGTGVPSTDFNDANSHGTHVAGTIGARTDNGVGVAGVAYFVSALFPPSPLTQLLYAFFNSSPQLPAPPPAHQWLRAGMLCVRARVRVCAESHSLPEGLQNQSKGPCQP